MQSIYICTHIHIYVYTVIHTFVCIYNGTWCGYASISAHTYTQLDRTIEMLLSVYRLLGASLFQGIRFSHCSVISTPQSHVRFSTQAPGTSMSVWWWSPSGREFRSTMQGTNRALAHQGALSRPLRGRSLQVNSCGYEGFRDLGIHDSAIAWVR